MAQWSGIDDRSVFLNSGPLFHIGTFMPNLSTFAMGGTNVFVRAVRRRRAVPRHRPVRLHRRVHRRPDGRRDRRGQRRRPLRPVDVPGPARQPGVRRVGAARRRPRGAATRAGTARPKTMGMATFNLLGPGGIGRTAARRRSSISASSTPTTHEVAAGEIGEIVVRGTTVMCGYWNRPELNAERARNGWHHTNDLGRYEADGTFTFVGPKARMFKSARREHLSRRGGELRASSTPRSPTAR